MKTNASLRKTPILWTADDFGLSPRTNREIAALLERGALNAVSIFAHSPFLDDALDVWTRTLDFLKNNAKIVSTEKRLKTPSLGLHFCLTSGRSVSEPANVPLLVDENGLFRNGFLSLLRLLRSSKGPEAARQIRLEFSAQVRRLDEAAAARGLVWNRIDSHCHLHAIPSIFEIVATEARRRGAVLRLPRERVGRRDRFFRSIFCDGGIGLAKKVLLSTLLKRSESSFPEFFAATEYFGVVDSGKMNRERLDAIFAEIDAENNVENVVESNGEPAATNAVPTIEINFHPWRLGAFSDADAVRFGASQADRDFARSPRRAVEWKTLAARDVRKR